MSPLPGLPYTITKRTQSRAKRRQRLRAMVGGAVTGARSGRQFASRVGPRIQAAGAAFGGKGSAAAQAIRRVLNVAGPLMGGAIGAFKARRVVGDDTSIGNMGGPQTTISVAGIGTSMNGATAADIQPMTHPKYGPGIRLTGRQLLCEVKGDGATTSILSAVSGAASIWITYSAAPIVIKGIFVNPASFGGRLSILSQVYSMFHFNVCKIDYMPAIGTAETGQLVCGFARDPDSFPQVDNFVDVLQTEPTFATPFYGRASSMYVDTDDKTFHVDASYAGNWVNTSQGVFLFTTNGVVKAATTYGYLYLSYDVEVFFPFPYVVRAWPAADARRVSQALDRAGYQRRFLESHEDWDVDIDESQDRQVVITVHPAGRCSPSTAASAAVVKRK